MFFCQRKNEIVKIIFFGVNWSQMESTMDTDLKQVDGKNWRLHLLYNGEMISELRITEWNMRERTEEYKISVFGVDSTK